MGQISSTDRNERVKYQDFISNYQFLRRIRDPRYGDISILEDKLTKEQVALKEVLSKDVKDFEKELRLLNTRFRISHPNIVRILGYTSKSEDNLCASFHKIFMIVEYLDSDLEKEILNKKNNSLFYNEEQLCYLTESMVKSLAVLQRHSLVHGDIKPSTIFISRMGVYKIAEHNIIGNVMPGYHQRLLGFQDVRTYLSPALMENLSRAEMKPSHNPWKSDVFSLGMTLLHAATLASCDSLYNWENHTIDRAGIDQRLKIIKGQYSDKLYQLISSMLVFDEYERPDFKTLDAKLNGNFEEDVVVVHEREETQDVFVTAQSNHPKQLKAVPTDVYEDESRAVLNENITINIAHTLPHEFRPGKENGFANPFTHREHPVLSETYKVQVNAPQSPLKEKPVLKPKSNDNNFLSPNYVPQAKSKGKLTPYLFNIFRT